MMMIVPSSVCHKPVRFFLSLAILFLFIHSVSSEQIEKTCISENGEQNPECQDESKAVLQKAHDFGQFLDTIFKVNDSYKGTNRTKQELVVLEAVFKHVDMDSSVLFSREMSGNWYLELHTRLTALAPPNSFYQVYQGRPTDNQLKIVAAMDPEAVKEASSRTDLPVNDALTQTAFRRYRFRGGTTRQAQVFRLIVSNPLNYWIGFAVPNDTVLSKIAQYGPLIEMGAGTAYWSALLQQHYGVDILVYDSEPPNEDDNVYFHNSYTHVLGGTCTEVFEKHPEYAKNRALLLVWPNNPDNVDSPDHFYSRDLPPVWDADCLRAYMRNGGKRVVFVGEREENVALNPRAPTESGLTASREFQSLLKQHFELEEQIDIPTWWSYDDATVWVRR